MARLSIGQKAQQVAVFLVALRHPRIARALRRHGFREADRLEGHRLLRELTDGVLDEEVSSATSPSAALLRRLDEWENKWFPIAEISLRFRFPEAHDFVFRNLRQTEGAELIVGVGTLVSRLDELPERAPRGAEARALLEDRGLDEHVLGIARAALHELDEEPELPAPPAISDAEFARREAAMWRWYREWSTIARLAVTDRRLLRSMGFLAEPHAAEAAEVPEAAEEASDEGAPAEAVEAAKKPGKAPA
jgi:hypothetical protein